MTRLWGPQCLVILMLLWALNPENPYAYYTLLRWICCGVFAYLAVQAAGQDQHGWVWVLGFTALIYNPVMPVYLTREIWSVVNVVTIGVAAASIFVVKQRNSAPGSTA